jgi:SMP-30/Gluconolactonase/LRE-like region
MSLRWCRSPITLCPAFMVSEVWPLGSAPSGLSVGEAQVPRRWPLTSTIGAWRRSGACPNRRVWADLDDGAPDGICLDAEGAVWYGDVPNQRCVRVSEGGEVLQTIDLDRGCFACMLGGADGKTLFLVTRDWGGPASIRGTNGPGAGRRGARTGRRLAIARSSGSNRRSPVAARIDPDTPEPNPDGATPRSELEADAPDSCRR